MNHDQEYHLSDIRTRFLKLVTEKYVKGAQEHGGNIWDHTALQLIDNAIDEVIDQFVYLYTLREKIEMSADMRTPIE